MANNITFVSIIRPAFEDEQAAVPWNSPRFKPPIEEILIIGPFCRASTVRLHTYFDTNNEPVKLVLKTWSRPLLLGQFQGRFDVTYNVTQSISKREMIFVHVSWDAFATCYQLFRLSYQLVAAYKYQLFFSVTNFLNQSYQLI